MSYTNVDNSVMDYNISDGAFKLYFYLQSMCYSDKTECYPSQKYLSQKLHKSVKTIQRYLSELLDKGLIKKKRRGSISNLYTVMLKVISQTANKIVENLKSHKENKKTPNPYKNPKKGHFNNYTQRNYDFVALERILSGEDSYDVSKIYKL